MQRRVIVLGSGAAGTAAALAAHRAGAHVTVVRGRPGATSLTAGGLDVDGSAAGGTSQTPSVATDEEARVVIAALGIYTLGSCRLATNAGTLRAAAGRDQALADLDAKAGPVLVARVAHPAWDADALAASYAEGDKTRDYVARDVGLVLHSNERAMTHTELAALHDDDDARLGRAAERIRAALAEGGTFTTVLVPPWLGVAAPRAAALSDRVGIQCGEILAALGGPSGARFERARDRCLAAIDTIADRARRVKTNPVSVVVGERTIEADAIVLATGGLLGGGIAYTPPPPTRAAFTLTYEAPVDLGCDGRSLMMPGSIFGMPPEALVSLVSPASSPLIERIGILRSEPLRGIHVAGDAAADRPRTLLEAFVSGAAAGRAAARM